MIPGITGLLAFIHSSYGILRCSGYKRTKAQEKRRMFVIQLIRFFGKVRRFLRQNSHPRIIVQVLLLICALLFLLEGCSIFNPTEAPSASAGVGDTLTDFPIKSTGCGKPSPVAPGTSVTQTIFSDGGIRSYLLHIPKEYRDTVGQALVLNFHGHGSSALQQEYRTGFSALADTYDIIVAYPQGLIGPDHHTGWDTGPLRNPDADDVRFVSDLLNHLQAMWCINPDRIYATGFSNGGGMTNVLACKLAGRIAAFASVSGSYPAVPGGCQPVRPVPFMELHGTGDKVVPYGGSLLKGYLPVALWLREWAERDGCTRGPLIFFDQANVIGEKWTDCRGHVTIIHYLIVGMGHTWPRYIVMRSQTHATILDATTLIWAFFQRYPLPTWGRIVPSLSVS
jgi:polyhydroxybutyrate depolymerase